MAVLRFAAGVVALFVATLLPANTGLAINAPTRPCTVSCLPVDKPTGNGESLRLAGVLTDTENRLFADAADGHWDEHTLLTAALVASGLESQASIDCYRKKLEEELDHLRQRVADDGSPRDKAKTLFRFMHDEILTGGYRLECTSLVCAFDEGRYNCVSASILFNCLAATLGLEARGLQMPGHAMSRLVFQDGSLDVETTCPGWYSLADQPQRRADLVEETLGFRPAAGEGKVREVSDVEFVAMVYYNRGVDLLANRRFAAALSANAKAQQLDPTNTTIRGNLLATLNNWAIELGESGSYSQATRLLKHGLRLDPGYEIFKANHVHVHLQWAESLCGEGKFQLAIQQLMTASEEQPEQPHFQQARLDILKRWSRARLQSRD
jgi:tetratricopeptide (TPR) repeat protein